MTTPVQHLSPCPKPYSDHTVGTYEGVDLPIRIFPAEADGTPRPWLLWIHGGGWSAGKHYIPNAWVIPAFRPLGYHVVSVAYRFFPHVTIKELWNDVSNSFVWAVLNLPKIVGAENVSIPNYIVGGDSAGGHLAAFAGLKLSPPPKVVLNVFGAVDLLDPAFRRARPREHMPKLNFPLDVVVAASKDRDPANAAVTGAWTWELEPQMSAETLQSFWGTDYVPGDKDMLRMDVLVYTSFGGGGRIPSFFGLDKIPEDVEGFDKELTKWSPLQLLDQAEQKGYPPTVVMHGDKDFLVPVKQAHDFAAKLREKGVDVVEIYDPEGGHCFEQAIGGPEYDGWKEYIVPCIEFVQKHVE
ncbi:hypothetical protein IAT38_003968 [Cryptococcus sp. DSM 104549]